MVRMPEHYDEETPMFFLFGEAVDPAGARELAEQLAAFAARHGA